MRPVNFDPVARIYRVGEYLALGPLLRLTRSHHLDGLADCRCALILGDGDGRFTAALLAANPAVQVCAVDRSGAMLEQLRRKAARYGNRLAVHHADALTFAVPADTDLMVTHFFLDCLEQAEVDALVCRLADALPRGGLWLFSDFRIPGGVMHYPAWLYVRALYLAFRVLTGLRVTRLPEHERAFRAAGLTLVAQHRRLGGMLTTELWQKARQGGYVDGRAAGEG